MSQNHRLLVGRDHYALKVHRPPMDAARVREMHRVMSFAARQGIPVAEPLLTQVVAGYVCSIYAFARGTHPGKYRGTHAHAEAMGDMLGRMHVVLDEFHSTDPKPDAAALWKLVRPSAALAQVERLRVSLVGHDRGVRIEIGRTLDAYEKLFRSEHWRGGRCQDLAIAVCHGDFHSGNILLCGDSITAVLDWEKAGWDFRCGEVCSSLIFNCRENSSELHWPRIATYLRAYRRHRALDDIPGGFLLKSCFSSYVLGLWTIEQYLGGRRDYRSCIAGRLVMAQRLATYRREYSRRIAELCARG